ncbi:MAG: ferritin family protein [Candidatus Latescibacteria bacterium]|nr:ferritin family protein [Candidatus Latescibacterota bacterium]MCK5732989.1 ferritin family protein [Candidatus Latescibacterota bacterium]
MSILFSGSEVVDLCIEIEKNGAAFYHALAASTKEEAVRKLASYLEAEEKKHQTIFEKMRSALKGYQPVESYPGEYELYMKALADARVFTSDAVVREMVAKVESDVEALTVAIGFEKDSILFLYEMKSLVPESEYGAIDALMQEEKSHLRQISEFKKERLGAA